MSDLQQRFEQMVTAVRDATIEFSPNNAQKLKLYAFYKQAIEGDVKGECPSVINMIERAKWQAWNAIKGMTSDKAMEGYLNIFNENK
jgi:acyl-CoA-binding protein